MRYEVEIGGRTRQVDVVRVGDGFAVELDGHTWKIDVARDGAHTLSLIVDNYARFSARAAFEVLVASGPAAGQLTVHVGSTPIAVTLNGRRATGAGAAGPRLASGPERVTAPMPGKVLRTYVNPGDVVKARQPLVVVEAMKMENGLRAGRDGTIAEEHAREGLSVDAGALLIVIQ